jgi:glycosyltransferase involved in cell wall biosynthesis
MKIGMMVDTYLPIMGGAEVHVLELSRALTAQDFQISICTAVPAGVGQAADEFPVLRLPALVGGGWRAALNLPRALSALLRFTRQVDFIHTHYSFLFAAIGTVLARLLRKPSAVTLHGLGTLDSSVGRSRLWRFYRYISLKCATTVIATSQEMSDVAARFVSRDKIVLIPNGVNPASFTSRVETKNTSQELVVLTMRRLAPKNGVQYLVEAAPAVIQAVPRARFWVAGEGKLEAYIRQRVSALQLEAYFQFLGVVPHSKTPAFYEQADIVVFPSSAESTSLACLEAMCMQKAIVASGLAPYREMLGTSGERGLLVDLFDRLASDYNAPMNLPAERIQALAQAIIRLARDPDLRLNLGQTARQYAIDNYDWRLIAEQTAQVYRSAAVEYNGPGTR